MKMIKVVIVDDQVMIREGLTMLVGHMNDMKVVATASNGQEAIDVCQIQQPDIVLMDVRMPILTGVEATKMIKEMNPKIKIIILTTFVDDDYIFQAVTNGASGYLLKDAGSQKVEEAILEVYHGGAMFQPSIAQKVVNQFQQIHHKKVVKDSRIEALTNRELEIIRLVGEGKNNEEIAKELFITKGTTKNHISSLLTKLELRDRTQLAIFSLKNDLV